MAILGLVINTFVAVLGLFLLVTAGDDALARTSGVAYTVLGFMWAGFYCVMLMGW